MRTTINNESTTEPPSKNGQQRKPSGAQDNFTRQNFTLEPGSVKTKNVKLAWSLPNISNVSSRGNNQIS